MSRRRGIKVIEYTRECEDKLVVALGFFDCLHIGHAKLIDAAKLLSFKRKAKCGVFTFANNPFAVLQKEGISQILNFEERLIKLDDMRVDYCLKAEFDRDFSQLPPERFLDRLCCDKEILGVVVGSDYTFGAGGVGNAESLSKWCREKNIELCVVPFAEINGKKISSSMVRKLLLDGELERANSYLGQPYCVSGMVVHGQERGRNLGFSTANLAYPQDKLKIRAGVYYTRVLIDGVWLKAVTNVGEHPTFDDFSFNIESHVLYYEGDLYGKKIVVRFLQRIRDIKKFTSKEELAARISQDINFALLSKL